MPPTPSCRALRAAAPSNPRFSTEIAASPAIPGDPPRPPAADRVADKPGHRLVPHSAPSLHPDPYWDSIIRPRTVSPSAVYGDVRLKRLNYLPRLGGRRATTETDRRKVKPTPSLIPEKHVATWGCASSKVRKTFVMAGPTWRGTRSGGTNNVLRSAGLHGDEFE